MYLQDFKLKHIIAFIKDTFDKKIEIVAIDMRHIYDIFVEQDQNNNELENSESQYIHVKITNGTDEPAWHTMRWNVHDEEFNMTAPYGPEDDPLFN